MHSFEMSILPTVIVHNSCYFFTVPGANPEVALGSYESKITDIQKRIRRVNLHWKVNIAAILGVILSMFTQNYIKNTMFAINSAL